VTTHGPYEASSQITPRSIPDHSGGILETTFQPSTSIRYPAVKASRLTRRSLVILTREGSGAWFRGPLQGRRASTPRRESDDV